MDPALRSGRSLVAGVNALLRVVESQRPAESRILQDPFAARLAEDHAAIWLLRLARFLLPPLKRAIDAQRTAHCVRHRAIDALIAEAIADGFQQIVLLGAGYDMRASRLPAPCVHWFEVDRGPILQRKARRLRGVPGLNPAVASVQADLAEGAALPGLCAAGFDRSAAAVFVLEGVVHYLSPDQVARLLAETALGPGPRRLILSFIDPAMVPRAGTTFRAMIRVLREIPRTYFAPEELAALAARFGWTGARHWTGPEQAREFAPQALGRARGLTQEVAWFEGGAASETSRRDDDASTVSQESPPTGQHPVPGAIWREGHFDRRKIRSALRAGPSAGW